MRTYSVEGGLESPSILIDESQSLVEISGNSTLKEVNWFYSNLLKWIIAFNSGTSKTEIVNIKLNRINDSSSKWITIIFKKLAALLPENHFEINWYIGAKNTRVLACGQLLQNQLGINVKLL
jgi:hypothetical protein